MKEELLKIAQESLSSEEVEVIVKEKFMKALGSAIDDAFRWGDAKKAIENKVKEVMVPYIESYDFSEYLPKLDSVLTEIVNSDFCIANKKVLENFKNLMLEPEQKEIKLTELFKAWIKQCEADIDTDGLDVITDDRPYYESVECEMSFELEDKPSWSSTQRAVITFQNEHDENLNVEIPVSKWIWRNGKEGPNGGKGQKRGEEYQKKYDYPFCHIKILLFTLSKKKPWIISRTMLYLLSFFFRL